MPQDSCDPAAKPGTVKFAQLLMTTYPDTGTYGISRECLPGDVSEHHEGRAWDWKVSVNNPAQVKEVNAVLDWLLATDSYGNKAANARRLGVMYIIWNRHILGTYRLDEGWRAYNGPDPHTNHVHFSLSWAGAMGRTSWWTGQVSAVDYGPCRVAGLSFAPQSDGAPNPTKCPSAAWPGPAPSGAPAYYGALRAWSGVTLKNGSTGPAVKAVQQALGVTADGGFGPETEGALKTFQSKHSLTASGVVDAKTWTALLQAAGGVSPATTPSPTPTPTSNPAGVPPRVNWSRPKPARFRTGTSSSRPVTSATAPKPVLGGPGALKPYAGTTLKVGSSGAPVKALQAALGITADGAFGPQTKGAVSSFQTGHGLSGSGVVDPSTWQALILAATLDPYRDQTLKYGSSGTAVKVLQQQLGITADGAFGPQTRSAVQTYQAKHSLDATGVVNLATWLALGA